MNQAILEVGTMSEYVGVETKKCSKCGEVKARTEFGKNVAKKDMLSSECKVCQQARHKAHYLTHREELINYQKNYAKANKEKVAARHAAYYLQHRETHNKNSAEDHKAQRLKDPHKMWAKRTFWDHGKKHTLVITLDELLTMARATTHCPLCDVKLDWLGTPNQDNLPSWDRKFNGKRMSKDNTWIICYQCNSGKRNKPLPEFEEHCIKVALKTGKVVRV